MEYKGPVRVLGIGAGPANLSLAALAEPIPELPVTVLESRNSVSWHPGLLWSDSRLQVSGVKDLVTPADPRSRFSFLNFLHEHGRLYRHLIANADHVSRKEFDQYFTWAAKMLDVRLEETVQEVDHDGRRFVVQTTAGTWSADNLVLGVGQAPCIPDFARPFLGPHLWHAANHLDHGRSFTDKDVLLVGGGQSGAEIAMDLISGRAGLPRQLTWVTGQRGFTPLDESPFSGEWFNPQFVEYFHEKSRTQRSMLLAQQSPAHHGTSQQLLQKIYKRLYEIDYLTPHAFRHCLMGGVELADLSRLRDGFSCSLQNVVTSEKWDTTAEIVVLATGFHRQLPRFMEPLRDRLPLAGDEYIVERDYRIAWDGPDTSRIFVQNAARGSHGVADPNLSLAAWRSAVIINSLLGRDHYALRRQDITLNLSRNEQPRLP
ncbi:lysine N(6)-hydroxylase/L-ornithine N(5)-oxygenase family protein [Streptomyces sp. NPDC054770]